MSINVTIRRRHSEGCPQENVPDAPRCGCRIQAQFTLNGKQKQVSLKTRIWGEAKEKRDELQEQLEGKKTVTTGNAAIRVSASVACPWRGMITAIVLWSFVPAPRNIRQMRDCPKRWSRSCSPLTGGMRLSRIAGAGALRSTSAK